MSARVKAQDAIWIATALLHRENPKAIGFSALQIKQRALREGFNSVDPGTLYQHAQVHCVANLPPNNSRLRMLWAVDAKLRRLYRPGDPFHPSRAGTKTNPRPQDIPEKCLALLQWYRRWSTQPRGKNRTDPLLALIASGKRIWADQHADEYVRSLREQW